MANAEEQQVVTNGNGVDSDEEDLSKMRPVDIDQDVREMERRKRVSSNVGNSRLIVISIFLLLLARGLFADTGNICHINYLFLGGSYYELQTLSRGVRTSRY